MDKKTLLIIAGANGSGKTTLAPFLYPLYHIEESVNPDLIAADLSLHPETVAFQAGRIALLRIQQLIERQSAFAYETTLASHTLSHLLQKMNRDHYKISLHFLALPSVQAATERVKRRVDITFLYPLSKDVLNAAYRISLTSTDTKWTNGFYTMRFLKHHR